MTRSRAWLFPWAAPLLFVASCGGSPPARLYVIGDPSAAAPSVVVQSGRPVVRLLPVSVPDYLDTREILRRDGRNEVTASPTGLWAERLSVGMTNALAASLATHLRNIVVVTGDPDVAPSREIKVDVLAFEIGADGRCQLTARWASLSGAGDKVLRRESDTFVEQAAPTNDAGEVEAMSRAIDRLTLQIVAASREAELASGGQDGAPARSPRGKL